MSLMLTRTLSRYLSTLDASRIPADRQAVLDPLAAYLRSCADQNRTADLVFICTHNSRRSHLGQIWAGTLSALHRIPARTWSGGTEATACNPRTLRALQEAGFEIEVSGNQETNPRYRVSPGADHPGFEVWSKVYTDPANPRTGFGAIMTCDSANEACPVVLGAEARFPIMYVDPKAHDDTPAEAKAYADCCHLIATEMLYVMERARG
ncbi:MAG: protein-tyrosine-phosphatase [Bacteroidia bacterium]|nr:protein-tyrosine-phosphatase [Bacteroidia bacterium]